MRGYTRLHSVADTDVESELFVALLIRALGMIALGAVCVVLLAIGALQFYRNVRIQLDGAIVEARVDHSRKFQRNGFRGQRIWVYELCYEFRMPGRPDLFGPNRWSDARPGCASVPESLYERAQGQKYFPVYYAAGDPRLNRPSPVRAKDYLGTVIVMGMAFGAGAFACAQFRRTRKLWVARLKTETGGIKPPV